LSLCLRLRRHGTPLLPHVLSKGRTRAGRNSELLQFRAIWAIIGDQAILRTSMDRYSDLACGDYSAPVDIWPCVLKATDARNVKNRICAFLRVAADFWTSPAGTQIARYHVIRGDHSDQE
jgi:hypothetical protein